MTGEIIKQFLVSLGFQVDDSTLNKFNKALGNAVVKVGLLAGSIKAAAAGTFYGISKISEGFEEMGYQYRIIAPMLNKVLYMRQQLLKAYRSAGINITDAVQQSVRFNMSLAKTKFQLEAIYKSVGVKFLPMLTKQMDIFRGRLIANMPKIIKFFENLVRFVFKAFEGVTILGTRLWSMLGRLYDLLVKLHDVTKGWSTGIIALIAAWRLLNLSFLATPMGMILTGLVALLALVDDYMTWQEGGESLFDWSKVKPFIDGLIEGIKAMWAVLEPILSACFDIISSIVKFLMGDMSGALDSWVSAGRTLIGLFTKLWDIVKEIAGVFFGNIGESIKGFFGVQGPSEQEQIDAARNRIRSMNNLPPLGSQGGNMTTQSVSQTTQIIVQGSSNPQATAREVVNQQNRVNNDMTRNMKGATR